MDTAIYTTRININSSSTYRLQYNTNTNYDTAVS